ncbi:MAG: DUF2167 domain-containing protein [Verrucomicrobiae bacterium]|nr:DUF2167 domain-containing protein [Verrucomicrobiae bacterium]
MKSLSVTLAALTLLLVLAPSPRAQEASSSAEETVDPAEMEKKFMEHVEGFGWEREGAGKLKSEAEITIPPGYRFTGTKGTQQLMEVYGNPKTDREYGLIAPESLDWFVVFEFEKSGYVKDDEKDEINDAFARKLLKSMQDNDKASNAQRRELGYPALHTRGWAKPPFYNEATNNLEWALDLESEDGGRTINFNTRLLGRYGVMESVLVCDPEQLDAVMPEYQNLIAGFQYRGGHRYAEYKSGDKVAKYGLTALIVGGGAAVAAKTGLLAAFAKAIAKGGKAIVVGIVALFAGIWKAIKRFFGHGD